MNLPGNPSLVQRIRRAIAAGGMHRLALPRGSASAWLWAGVFAAEKRPYLLVEGHAADARRLYADLQHLAGSHHVFLLPSSFRHIARPQDTDPFDEHRRWQSLINALDGRPAIIVTHPAALLEKVADPQAIARRRFDLRQDETVDPEFLNEWLFDMDFQRADLVTEPGEFALRGGIIDVFPYNTSLPYRIEFDDDRIRSMAPFDPGSQLRLDEPVSRLEILGPPRDDEVRVNLGQILPPDTVVYLASHTEVENLSRSIPKKDSAFLWRDFTVRDLPAAALFSGAGPTGASIPHHIRPLPSWGGNFETFTHFLTGQWEANRQVWIACANPDQRRRLSAILSDKELDGPVRWLPYDLWEGFTDDEISLTLIPEHRIFNRPAAPPKDRLRKQKQHHLVRELSRWQKGDYIVHTDHGIGIFEGLVRIERRGRPAEAVKLRYRDDDVIYISIHNLHKLSKYRNKDGTPPAVHRLGSAAWQRSKERTKKRLKKLAFDLLSLYAERKKQKGFAFGPDTPVQWEMESGFMYDDTPDQARAVAEIKRDMESERPMDRLVCGDVGFGKTEVAIRAAFKAVDNGKQVAVLVPTTVLAFQHYRSFSERLRPFPVRIDYLNRFRTAAQRKQILSGLADGQIDIIIGTHALVSDKIRFKDLGLLIIDEEQKFGVNIKEKIKHLKKNIDVLTLTATPIPRTLQFSLMGERDLSVIQTPPPNRIPVETRVIRPDWQMIREAIRRELDRGGQVFFVHNRIRDLDRMEMLLRKHLPDARIAVAHGQTEGRRLEKIMLDFVRGQYDILLSTAIIENGLDVPNANTILVNDAHRFGLADLHQLRGRVGRSNRKAYCYFLVPSRETLTDEARKRMRVLENYTALGSGFDIAMHDLEIRGAGDLLGAEQSGFINDLGFELYQKILAEAVDEIRRENFAEQTEPPQGIPPHRVQFHTDRSWYIPPAYIPSSAERMEIYRRLNDAPGDEALDALQDEIRDRFGPLPGEVAGLILMLRIKLRAARLGLARWQWTDREIKISPDFESRDADFWLNLMARIYSRPDEGAIRPQDGNKFYIVMPPGTPPRRILDILDRWENPGE